MSHKSTEMVPIETQLRPALDEAGVAHAWRRIGDTRAARRSLRRRVMVAGGGLAIAAAVALAVSLPPRFAGPSVGRGALRIAMSADAPLEALPAGGAIALDDGSVLEVAQATELEVLANDGARFVTLLRRGRCRFDVRPGGPRRWSIETDLATVEVVGTAFTVDRGEGGLYVTVEHGIVLVRGERVPGRVQRLLAGERLDIPAPTQSANALDPQAAAVSTPSSAQTGSRGAAQNNPAVVLEPGTVASGWEPPAGAVSAGVRPASLASGAASPASQRVDGSSAVLAARGRADFINVAARLADSDRARVAGRPEDAATILEQAIRDGGDDPQVTIAAFSLGRLQLEVLGRPGEAAESFARVVERGSPRALVEDAQARRVEALVRSGRRLEARRAAMIYEARWPNGRRLEQVRALVGEP